MLAIHLAAAVRPAVTFPASTAFGWYQIILLAKFQYAILVADRSEAGRRPVADLLASYIVRDSQIPARYRSATRSATRIA